VPADDDLFPPIRPPADATALQADVAAAEEGEDAADADADAATGDGSDTSEESDEVSFSVLKFLKKSSSLEDKVQDIEFIMEPANRSLDLRCVARLLRPVTYRISLQAKQTRTAHRESHATKRFSCLSLPLLRSYSTSRYSPPSWPIINNRIHSTRTRWSR
jgi:hypothetical protein